MIKTLSPYYINIPWINPSTTVVADSVLIRVYVWNGNKNTVPVTATYEAIKQNPTESNGTVKVNIANWINDFITLDTNTNITVGNFDGNNQQWVKWEVYYSLDEINYEPTPQQEDTKLFCRGYSYGMEGENVEVSEGFLIPVTEYKVSRDSFITIPYLINEADPPIVEHSIIITDVVSLGSNQYEVYFTFTGSFDSFDYIFQASEGDDFIAPTTGTPVSPKTVVTDGVYISVYIKGIKTGTGDTLDSNTYII